MPEISEYGTDMVVMAKVELAADMKPTSHYISWDEIGENGKVISSGTDYKKTPTPPVAGDVLDIRIRITSKCSNLESCYFKDANRKK